MSHPNPAGNVSPAICTTTTPRQPLRIFAALALSLTLPLQTAFGEEGMWTLDHLPLAAMQRDIGFTPPAGWAEHLQRSAVRLAGGCSGSFVSPDGLVLTNHHCAVACVEQLSSKTQDLVQQGFQAHRREEEQRCPDMELNQLQDITDVTGTVQAALGSLRGAEYAAAKRKIEAQLTAECAGEDTARKRCDMVELYQGARFNLYRYRRYQDVRLVFAPEVTVAFFGGDPDNFSFPRFNLDCAFLRAYENGQPVHSTDYLPFHAAGAAEGEPVFVLGHPGRTLRGLTDAQLAARREVELIPELLRLSQLRGYLTRDAETNAEEARIGHTDLFRVENARKALLGTLGTLQDPTFLQSHASAEHALQAWVKTRSDLPAETAQAWDQVAEAMARYRQFAADYSLLETRLLGSPLLRQARTLVRAARERTLPDAERLPEYSQAALPRTEQLVLNTSPVYPEYEQRLLARGLVELREVLGSDHPLVRQVLGKESPEAMAERVIRQSALASLEARRALWQGGAAAVQASHDPLLALASALDGTARALRKRKEEDVDSVVRRNADLINRARFARDGDGVYPDATFTLRLTYGRVGGWQEGDHSIAPFTDFAGAFVRNTGADPFRLPASWLAAQSQLPAAQPFNFTTTNDIIGGNSGSPTVNRAGELVGLIFDGNQHSAGGAFYYDPAQNRAIAVHAGAILSALELVYANPTLARELRQH